MDVGPLAPACLHSEAVEVLRAVDDELVAWLCPTCDVQLPADFVGYRGLDRPLVGYTERGLSFVELHADLTLLEHNPDPRMQSAWKQLMVAERDRAEARAAHTGWTWQWVVTATSLLLGWIGLWVEVYSR